MANVALLDHALDRVAPVTGDVAVNVFVGRASPDLAARALLDHLTRAARPGVVASEEPERLGTAGAIGHLRPWALGRDVLVVNGDTWCPAPLSPLLEGWDRRRVRVLVAGPEPFGPRARIVASLLPGAEAAALEARPSGLYEVLWAGRHAAGRLETLHWGGPFVDCARPADYLRANLEALAALRRDQLVAADAAISGTAVLGRGVVVGPGARVAGHLRRCVVWEDSRVEAGEVLSDAVRAGPLTVVVP